MNSNPLISIVTAVRNGALYLPQLVNSVLQQDYSNFEHIIIDDGSTDGGATVTVLKNYRHLHWWSRGNKGQYATQNEGIAAAQGNIISIISSDDVYVTPSAFTHVINYWDAHPECKIVYGKTLQMDEKGKLLPYQVDITGRYPQWLLRHYLYIQHCSLFVAKDLVMSGDGSGVWFDPSFKYAGDWDWIIRLFSATPYVGYVAQPLAIVRIHDKQTSRTATYEAIMREHKRICITYGANYHLHLFLRKIFQYRAMTLIARAMLRVKGFSGLADLGKDWVQRRYEKS